MKSYLENFLDVHDMRVRNIFHDILEHLGLTQSHLHLSGIFDFHLFHGKALRVWVALALQLVNDARSPHSQHFNLTYFSE